MTKKPRARFKGGGDAGRHFAVLRAVRDATDLSTAERCMLLMIEAHVGFDYRETGWCWPAVATLGDACGLSERQAFRVLAALREKHWIEVEPKSERGCQVTSWYRVTPERAASRLAESGAGPVH